MIVIIRKSGTLKIKDTIRLPLSFKTNDLIWNWKVLKRRKILHLYMKTDMTGRGKVKHPVGYTRWMFYSFGFMITFSELCPSINGLIFGFEDCKTTSTITPLKLMPYDFFKTSYRI